MAKGGKQPGAGRPKGSFNRPQMRDHISEKDIMKIVRTAKEKALEGNETMLRVLIEQIFGKPPQALEMSGKDGQPLTIKIVQYDGNNSAT